MSAASIAVHDDTVCIIERRQILGPPILENFNSIVWHILSNRVGENHTAGKMFMAPIPMTTGTGHEGYLLLVLRLFKTDIFELYHHRWPCM